MFDEIKPEMKAKLVFQFIDNSERPKELQILNQKKKSQKISKN